MISNLPRSSPKVRTLFLRKPSDPLARPITRTGSYLVALQAELAVLAEHGPVVRDAIRSSLDEYDMAKEAGRTVVPAFPRGPKRSTIPRPVRWTRTSRSTWINSGTSGKNLRQS